MAAPFHECPKCGMKARTLPGLSGHIRWRHTEEFEELDRKRDHVADLLAIAVRQGKLDATKALDNLQALRRYNLRLLNATEITLLHMIGS